MLSKVCFSRGNNLAIHLALFTSFSTHLGTSGSSTCAKTNVGAISSEKRRDRKYLAIANFCKLKNPRLIFDQQFIHPILPPPPPLVSPMIFGIRLKDIPERRFQLVQA